MTSAPGFLKTSWVCGFRWCHVRVRSREPSNVGDGVDLETGAWAVVGRNCIGVVAAPVDGASCAHAVGDAAAAQVGHLDGAEGEPPGRLLGEHVETDAAEGIVVEAEHVDCDLR